jgi:hypothetical protein
VVDDFVSEKELDKFSVVFFYFRVFSLDLVLVKVKPVSVFQELNEPIIDDRVINLVVNNIFLNKLLKGGYFIRQRAQVIGKELILSFLRGKIRRRSFTFIGFTG